MVETGYNSRCYPDGISEFDQECFDRVLAVPGMRENVHPTGTWGRRIVDVQITSVPPNIVVQPLFILSDESNPTSESVQNCIRLVVYRWDCKEFSGWKTFPLVLKFPDGSELPIVVPDSRNITDGHSLRINVPKTTTLTERKYQKNRNIPRIIFNLAAKLNSRPPNTRRYLESRRKLIDVVQCTSLFIILGDAEMLKLVQDSNIPNFLTAYLSVIPGSFKADMVRYYLIYRFGGMYHDDKSFVRHCVDSPAFDSILQGEGAEESRCDMLIGSEKKKHEITYLAARPGSPIMLLALEKSIENILKRVYGKDSLDITGCTMLTTILNESNLRYIPRLERSSKASQDFDVKWEICRGEIIAPLAIDDDTLCYIFAGCNPQKISQEIMAETLSLDPLDAKKELEKIAHGQEIDIHWSRTQLINQPFPPTYYDTMWHRREVYIDKNIPLSSSNSGVILSVVLFFIFGSLISLLGWLISQVKPYYW